MLVTLMRHGLAQDRDDPHCPPDPERRLTEEGIRRARQAAHGLARLDIAPELVLSSPYRRARQTADIAAAALGLKDDRVVETTDLAPEADPDLLLAELRKRNAQSILCVGHLPHLDRTVARMLGLSSDITSLKKAGAVCVELPRRGGGTLVWLATPKLLRRLGE